MQQGEIVDEPLDGGAPFSLLLLHVILRVHGAAQRMVNETLAEEESVPELL